MRSIAKRTPKLDQKEIKIRINTANMMILQQMDDGEIAVKAVEEVESEERAKPLNRRVSSLSLISTFLTVSFTTSMMKRKMWER